MYTLYMSSQNCAESSSQGHQGQKEEKNEEVFLATGDMFLCTENPKEFTLKKMTSSTNIT